MLEALRAGPEDDESSSDSSEEGGPMSLFEALAMEPVETPR